MGQIERPNARMVPQQRVQFGVVRQVGRRQVAAQHMEHPQFRVAAQIQLLQRAAAPDAILQIGDCMQVQFGQVGVEAGKLLERRGAAQVDHFQPGVFIAGQVFQRRQIGQFQPGQVVFAAI